MARTERYLAAVLRSIPEPKRTDVERELRSSIEDAIEERLAAGVDASTAERAVLEALGDPSALAAAYTGRPSYLIGPELYPLYRWFLPRLIAVAVPTAALVLGAVQVAGGGGLQAAISSGISAAINVGIGIAFWATVTFVFLERAGPARQARSELVAATGQWRLERLPKVSDGRISVREVAGEIATALISIGILVFAGSLAATTASGVDVPLLDRDFRNVWLPILVALFALRGFGHLLAYNAGRWTPFLAFSIALLQVLLAVPLVVAALTGSIVSLDFARVIGWPDLANGGGAPMLAIAVATILISAWEIVRIVLRARRAQGLGPLVGAPSQSA
jgi:hypothetical protein